MTPMTFGSFGSSFLFMDMVHPSHLDLGRLRDAFEATPLLSRQRYTEVRATTLLFVSKGQSWRQGEVRHAGACDLR